MLKKAITIILLGVFTLNANPFIDTNETQIDNNTNKKWYVGAHVENGDATITTTYDNNPISIMHYESHPRIITLGAILKNDHRIELVYNTLSNKIVGINGVLAIKKFQIDKVAPYASSDFQYLSEESIGGFGIRLGLGVFYKINDELEIDLGYKYSIYNITSKIQPKLKLDARSNTLGIGLRFKF